MRAGWAERRLHMGPACLNQTRVSGAHAPARNSSLAWANEICRGGGGGEGRHGPAPARAPGARARSGMRKTGYGLRARERARAGPSFCLLAA